jgi:acyl-CoA hydrolase
VNSALEVDLWGQANVERAGGRVVGGVGGLMDFMHGARRSPGGVSILALPATARGGSVSRIVPLLGGPVSVARHDVDIVVTEFGSADLRGVSDAERARRLTAIAAPDFRDTLWRDWQAG